MVSPHADRLSVVQRLSFAAMIALAGIACDVYVQVNGVVRDHLGAPVDNVAVELQTVGREPHRTKTGSDGSFHVDMVGAEPTTMSIFFRKAGYQDLRRALTKDARPTINVTLAPVPVQ